MRLIKAWIKKYIIGIASPSTSIYGYKYEYDFLMARKRGRRMTREEAIEILQGAIKKPNTKDGYLGQAIDMAIQSLTAISELSKSLKAVNRYDMDEKVLIGFNMAVAIFNKCFGENRALKNEQSEQNVGMCQQDVGEISEKQTDGEWIAVIDEIDSLGNKTWHYECSICGNSDSGWGDYKYCPNCGARMKGESE